jgi:SAM-dependent methyltransferase
MRLSLTARRAVAVAVGASYVGGVGYIIMTLQSPAKQEARVPTPGGGIWSSLAAVYDDGVGREEWFVGMPLLRRYLVRQAAGTVLEVSAGTGRNLQYYGDAVTAALVCDKSPEMLAVAASKRSTMPAGKLPERFVFKVADSTKLPFVDDYFGR